MLLGAFVTAFYSFRLLYLTFHGKERFHDPVPDHYVAPEADSTEHEDALAHEHERTMRTTTATATATTTTRTRRTNRRGW